MIKADFKKLEEIKNLFTTEPYTLLSKIQWEKSGRELSDCGRNILKEVERIRNDARKMRITFLKGRQELDQITFAFDEIAKNFDFFFDTSLRWIRSVIDGNVYEEHQILLKKGVESLVEHCRQAIDYLANIISFKRNDYWQYRNLSWIKAAVIIAIMTLIIVVINLIKS